MPLLPLGKILQAAKHRVIFAGPPKHPRREYKIDRAISTIENAGFQYYPVLASHDLASGDLWKLYSDALTEGARLLKDQRVDVVLVDSFVWLVALASVKLGIPTAFIHTNLRTRMQWSVPPSISSAEMTGSLRSRLRIWWEWIRIWMGWTIMLPFFGLFVPRARSLMKLIRTIRREARGVGLRMVLTDFFPEFELPSVTLSPAAFDFLPVPYRCYFGLVDETRADATFEWPATPGKYKVFCSPGTLTSGFRGAAEIFVKTCLATFSSRPDLSVVLQVTNDEIRNTLERDFINLPPNVSLREWVPQLAVLRHADVAIVAGGLGTLKECILAGVPPVVLTPRHADKPGNAARVKYHGIGRASDVHATTPELLSTLIDDVIGRSKYFRRNMQPIQAELRDSYAADRFTQFVESLAMSR